MKFPLDFSYTALLVSNNVKVRAESITLEVGFGNCLSLSIVNTPSQESPALPFQVGSRLCPLIVSFQAILRSSYHIIPHGFVVFLEQCAYKKLNTMNVDAAALFKYVGISTFYPTTGVYELH